MQKKEVLTELQVTLEVIGGKWKPLILHYLQKNGTKRYSEIFRFLDGAPKKTLTAQLRELEADKIIERTVIPTVPVQVEYSITEHGKTLFPLLDIMCAWGYINQAGYQITHPTCPFDKKEQLLKKEKLVSVSELFKENNW